jgi:hypothetical protein
MIAGSALAFQIDLAAYTAFWVKQPEQPTGFDEADSGRTAHVYW